MSVTFTTSDPKALLKAFDQRIAQTEPKGKITTWEKLDDGIHYTHKAKEWSRKAFFKPSVEDGQLIFSIIKPKSENISTQVYAYYHGHLTETFLNHFDRQFTDGVASALPRHNDNISS